MKELQTKDLLVVENDYFNRELIKRTLGNNFIYDIADEGREAIALAGNNLYKLVIIDIHLGAGMSGIDVMREIKKNPMYFLVPFIAMTAYVGQAEKKKFLDAGFNHYLPKPFNIKSLYELISSLIK